MSDAVAFACFRVLFVAHNKRMKELLHEHIVTLFNLNYGVEVGKTGKQENRKTGSQKGAVPQWIRVLPYKQPTLEKIYLLYERYGTETAFNRSDVMQATGLTGSPASALLTKMRKADLLERLNGADYGKYRFKTIIGHEG